MKILKLFAIALFASVLVASLMLTPAVKSQSGPTEAPAAFDDQTNGFEPQGSDPNVTGTFVGDKAIFEKRDTVATGLGPVYNAQSCAECHQNRTTGASAKSWSSGPGTVGLTGSLSPRPEARSFRRAPLTRNFRSASPRGRASSL